MKGKVILLAISLLSFNVNAQNFKEYWENGNIKSEGDTLNGVRNGLWKLYYDTGGLEEEGNYENGLIKGSWINFYHVNGTKFGPRKKESVWQDGKVKKWTLYYFSGIPKIEFYFRQPLEKEIFALFLFTEMELNRCSQEIREGKQYTGSFDFKHIPIKDPYLENEFQKTMKLSSTRQSALNKIEKLQHNAFFNICKVNKLDCDFFYNTDSEKMILEHRIYNKGIEEYHVMNEYYGQTKKIYSKSFYNNQLLKEQQIFMTTDTSSYNFKSFHDGKILICEGNVKKGLKEGKWKFYNERGQSIKEIVYSKGVSVSLE